MTSSDLQLSKKYQRDLKKPNTVEFTILNTQKNFENTLKKTLNTRTYFEPSYDVLVWKFKYFITALINEQVSL